MAYAHRRFVYTLVCFILVTLVSAQVDLECPVNVTQNMIYGDEEAIVYWPDVTQNGNFTVTCNTEDKDMVKSGDVFPVGETVVICMDDTGSMCEFTITLTECFPCANGDNQTDTCACECIEFHQGLLCDECTDKGCMNDGQWNDTTCDCDCSEGFEGEFCTECTPKNCTNGGEWNKTTCKCDCLVGFEGELCTECTPKNCMNGGVWDDTTCECDCLEGFEGELCAHCKECFNDGINQNDSTCACECTEVREGLLCEDCVRCENGGSLQNQYTCECDCQELWTGPLCAVCPRWLSCMNGGTSNEEECSCKCAKDWTGKDCSALCCSLPKKVPNFPDDKYPDVEGEKTIQIEIAVTSSNSSKGVCDVAAHNTSEQCQSLVDEFKNKVEKLYQRLRGFKEVRVESIRAGSVIVKHEVIYNYAKMSEEGKRLSALDLYYMTVGTAVSEGDIGGLAVSYCGECEPPKDLTDICDADMNCDTLGFEKYEMKTDGSCYLICQSICQSDICGEEGTCNQEQDSGVITCRCPQTSEVMYIGSNCQFKIKLLWLYVGCGVGGSVLLLLIFFLIACVIRCNKEIKKLKKGHCGKNTDNELRGEVIAVHNNGFVGDTATADDERGNTSSLTQARPYSYIYGKEDGANGVSRSNSGVAQRNSRYESTVYTEQPQDVDDLARLNQQQRSSYFWGNLSDPVKEETELIPMVRDIDPSKMYKIQRPQISMSKHDDLPDRDYF